MARDAECNRVWFDYRWDSNVIFSELKNKENNYNMVKYSDGLNEYVYEKPKNELELIKMFTRMPPAVVEISNVSVNALKCLYSI